MITITNLLSQTAHILSDDLLSQMRELAAFCLVDQRVQNVELNILLVEEPESEELHIRWLGELGPTDVMSFPIDEIRPGDEKRLPDGMRAILGDVVICPSVALKQATAAGHSLTRELFVLLAHGVLHLLGYDHQSEGERKIMFGLQERLVEEFTKLPACGTPHRKSI